MIFGVLLAATIAGVVVTAANAAECPNSSDPNCTMRNPQIYQGQSQTLPIATTQEEQTHSPGLKYQNCITIGNTESICRIAFCVQGTCQ